MVWRTIALEFIESSYKGNRCSEFSSVALSKQQLGGLQGLRGT